MAQHDYIIANQSGAAFRSDLNNGLAAIVSQNSGAAQPSTTYAYQTWADTTTGLMKIRNAANNAWITLWRLDGQLAVPTTDGTADQSLVTNGSGTLSFASRSRLVSTIAVATTSGTSIDFTSIPSWVKKITVMLEGVSTIGASLVIVQLGDSGGPETSGYATTGTIISGANACDVSAYTDGFPTIGIASTAIRSGLLTLALVYPDVWVGSGSFVTTNSDNSGHVQGRKELSGTLDRIRLTTSAGTDTFDQGAVNIIYEG
jgi:hypothetical protein